MHQVIIFYTTAFPHLTGSSMPVLEKGSSIKSVKYQVQKNSVLVSKLNPSTRRIWYPLLQEGHISICSTEFMQFIPRDNKIRPYLWGVLTSNYFNDCILKTVTGTTGSRQRAQPKRLAKEKIILTSKGLEATFSKIVRPLLDLMNQDLLIMKKLITLRDALLPKLLTGEIDLSKINIEKDN